MTTRYKFFTPYHRGFDLVWDYLCHRLGVSYTDGIMTITATNGYERARDLKLTADGQQIGHGTELWDRFDALEPAFRKFWKELEQDATDWQAGRELAANTKDENQKQQDAAFCAKVLSAYTSE